jgi:threonine/homoserine/homoserine lactone efflux protein
MFDGAQLITYAVIILTLVLTPGPNMLYLISRSICQGKKAGLFSLAGIAVGFIFYMVCAALGITALVMTIPYAYETLKFCGVAFLFYLAWQAIKPRGRSPFQVSELKKDSSSRLFLMGLITNLLNPASAMIYLSILPQFIIPERGNILAQSLTLGFIQILISITVNCTLVVLASSIAGSLAQKPSWLSIQRWVMGVALAVMAVTIALGGHR